MDARRVRLLSEEVYRFVFEMLDSEPDMNGNEAGRIATICQRTFENEFDKPERLEYLRSKIESNLDSCDATDSDVHYFGKDGVRGFDYLNHDCSDEQ